jgi:hypothetical protein
MNRSIFFSVGIAIIASWQDLDEDQFDFGRELQASPGLPRTGREDHANLRTLSRSECCEPGRWRAADRRAAVFGMLYSCPVKVLATSALVVEPLVEVLKEFFHSGILSSLEPRKMKALALDLHEQQGYEAVLLRASASVF